MRLPELSIAAPAYDEAAGIERVVGEWLAYLAGRFPPGAFEVVVCDDGSRDGTDEVLARLAAANPALRVATHPRNRGAAAAMASAIRATTKDWVLLLDADGQFPIRNVERFEAASTDPATRAFTGARVRKADGAWARLGSHASGFACNLVHGTAYRDFNSAFKLVQGPLLRALPLEARGLNYSTEITARLIERGVAPLEVEIEHLPRTAGRSSMRPLMGAADRLAFVGYLGLRRLLIRTGVLRSGCDEAGA